MDSADLRKLQSALSAQGTEIHQHEMQLSAISQGVEEDFQMTVSSQIKHLAGQLRQVLTLLGTTPSAAASVENPGTTPISSVMAPTTQGLRDSGESGDCRTFLDQCDLHFRLNPGAFVSEQAKVAFMVSHLTGRAAAWATAEWSRDSNICQSLDMFQETMSKIFDHSSPAGEASRALMQLKQRHRQVVDYAIEFRTVAANIAQVPKTDSLKDTDNFSDYLDLSKLPSCYHDIREVFNKSKAMSLLPHRPFDCAIDLLPGAPIPKGRLYSLTVPERAAMDDYISSSLKAGIIRPSSSPAGAGFFCAGKTYGTLQLCIDYSPLNDITVKNRYPLPLISSAFELLQSATVFTKLDLRNAYHLIRIREGDVWKTGLDKPTGHYDYLVMPFGRCNAPAVFQTFVNDVLREFLNAFVFLWQG